MILIALLSLLASSVLLSLAVFLNNDVAAFILAPLIAVCIAVALFAWDRALKQGERL